MQGAIMDDQATDRWGGKITGHRGEVPVVVTEHDDRGRPTVRIWFRRPKLGTAEATTHPIISDSD